MIFFTIEKITYNLTLWSKQLLSINIFLWTVQEKCKRSYENAVFGLVIWKD